MHFIFIFYSFIYLFLFIYFIFYFYFFFFFWNPTKGHNSKSYGALVLIPVYTIHPVIVHVYTKFQLSSFHSSQSVTNIFKYGKIWKSVKDHNCKSYGPVATILPLHLFYLRDQVRY